MTAPDLSKLSDRDRKTYLEGMAIVKRKLATARQAEAARLAEQAKRSAQALVKRMGADLARKVFGVSPAKPSAKFFTPATKPATPAKSSPRKFMSISFGHAQTARRLAGTA